MATERKAASPRGKLRGKGKKKGKVKRRIVGGCPKSFKKKQGKNISRPREKGA